MSAFTKQGPSGEPADAPTEAPLRRPDPDFKEVPDSELKGLVPTQSQRRPK